MSCRKIARAVCMAAAAVMACAAKAEDCVVTNVAPLINSRWTQGAPYNDYSPLGWVAGCVATAGAQEFRYWQWPWSFDGVRETSHPVAGNEDSQIRFDGHVPFEWDAMQDSYSGSESLASRHAAARLELFVQSLVQMNFISSGAMNMKSIVGATDWYEFDQTVKPYESAEARDAVLADLQWGSPMQVGLNVSGYGGHEGVGVGYGESADGKPLLAINLGWGGDVQWWDLTATSGNYVKDAKIGFRPIKSVQIEPVAPVSGSDVTIKWHLPNCYTNKVSGFTVAKKTVDPTVVTWSDDFSDGGTI